MKTLLKLLLLVSLLSSQILFANSASEEAYDKSTIYYEKQDYVNELKWLKISFDEEASKEVAFNIGLAYDNLKDYNNAINWYKKSFKMGDLGGGLNAGVLYKKVFKDYPNAIKWYKKTYNMGNANGGVYLGILYEEQKDIPNAIKWYKMGVKNKNYDSMRGLGNLYYKQKENIKGAAYMLGLLSIKPEKKEKLLSYLKTKWKLTDQELKKAYELQKTLVPNPYTGGID